eukprot:2720251-Prymnesium_polylepis.1
MATLFTDSGGRDVTPRDRSLPCNGPRRDYHQHGGRFNRPMAQATQRRADRRWADVRRAWRVPEGRCYGRRSTRSDSA